MKRRLYLTSLSEPLPNVAKLQIGPTILKNKCIINSVDNIMCYNIDTINKIKCHHQNHILVHFHQPQTKLQIYYGVIYCPQLQFLKIQQLFTLCIYKFFFSILSLFLFSFCFHRLPNQIYCISYYIINIDSLNHRVTTISNNSAFWIYSLSPLN